MSRKTSPSSTSQLGPACSEKPCASPLSASDSEVSLWVTLSGKAVRRPLSWRGWKGRAWVSLLSGTKLKPSTAGRGAARWISSVRGIRANHSRPPGSAVAQAILATFGPRCVAQLRTLNPASCSSRTSTDTSASARGKSSGISDDWATALRRDCLRRRKLARPTGAQGCFSWRSPQRANAVQGTKTAEQIDAQEHPFVTLGDQTRNWPTPRTADERGATYQRDRMTKGNERATLSGHARMWPTPKTPDRGPETRESKAQRPQTGGIDLQTEAKLWPTPTAPDTKVGDLPNRTGGPALSVSAEVFPDTPPPGTTGGPGLVLRSWTRPECPRLSPAFAAWLMGWCPGLTSFDLSATVWTLWRRHTLSCLYSLVSGGD